MLYIHYYAKLYASRMKTQQTVSPKEEPSPPEHSGRSSRTHRNMTDKVRAFKASCSHSARSMDRAIFLPPDVSSEVQVCSICVCEGLFQDAPAVHRLPDTRLLLRSPLVQGGQLLQSTDGRLCLHHQPRCNVQEAFTIRSVECPMPWNIPSPGELQAASTTWL